MSGKVSDLKYQKYQKHLSRFEHFTNRIIPYLLILLALVLLLDNPLWAVIPLHEYEPWISIFDWIIVFFFAVDLTFKWFHVKAFKPFVKLYWIDILAVFPFYLVFRVYREAATFFRVGEEATEVTQRAAHELLLLRESEVFKEGRLTKEVELLREERLFARGIRLVQRLLRVLKARVYVTHHALMDSSYHRKDQ